MPDYEVHVFTVLEADTPEAAAYHFLELLTDSSWATHVDAKDVATGEVTTVETN